MGLPGRQALQSAVGKVVLAQVDRSCVLEVAPELLHRSIGQMALDELDCPYLREILG